MKETNKKECLSSVEDILYGNSSEEIDNYQSRIVDPGQKCIACKLRLKMVGTVGTKLVYSCDNQKCYRYGLLTIVYDLTTMKDTAIDITKEDKNNEVPC